MVRLQITGIGILTAVSILCGACHNVNTPTVEEFILPDGVEIAVIAHEPTVILPVAMCEDIEGRWWVVEMPGYMRDIEGNNEDLPDGRVVILEDTNGDGLLNHRTIFLDSLLNPRAVALVYGGLLYTDGTSLLWTTVENDRPGISVLVDSLYVIGGNIEHQPNGLLYNLDNWIYSAKSNARYQRRDGLWLKEATTFRGQWGISMDANGRLVYNHNSIPMAGDYSMPNTMIANPHLKLNYSCFIQYTKDLRVYPIQATSVNRGYIDGVLNKQGKLIHYTSACSPLMYYGGSLPAEYYGDAFVCAPEANLIANYNVKTDDLKLSASRSIDSTEFIISKDESFRPVNLYTGFDGSLYIVDMRKGIIQHRAYMSNYLRENILKKGLDQVNGKGRIYKVSAKNDVSERPDFSANNLPRLLNHENLSVRMQAQKMLVNINDSNIVERIELIARDTTSSNGQIHALWTLHGMGALTAALLNEIGLITANEHTLNHTLILSDKIEGSSDEFKELYNRVWSLKRRTLDYTLASQTGQGDDWHQEILKDLAARYQRDTLLTEALLSGAAGNEDVLLAVVNNDPGECFLFETLNAVISNKKEGKIQSPQLFLTTFDDNRTNGFKLFRNNCSACHGMDGTGQNQVAPALTSSEHINGPEVEIANIILNGFQPASTDYIIPMPSYGSDNLLSDKDITDIVSYLKSTFTAGWSNLKEYQVDSLRHLSRGVQ